jgi:hypothetical protein
MVSVATSWPGFVAVQCVRLFASIVTDARDIVWLGDMVPDPERCLRIESDGTLAAKRVPCKDAARRLLDIDGDTPVFGVGAGDALIDIRCHRALSAIFSVTFWRLVRGAAPPPDAALDSAGISQLLATVPVTCWSDDLTPGHRSPTSGAIPSTSFSDGACCGLKRSAAGN